MKRIFFRGRFIFIPLAVAAFLTAISFIVMQLWNNLMPAIFHLGVITFWQAMGLFVLCKILFGFGKGKGGFGGRGPWMMRQRMQERFKNMSPEERERFKQQWAERCGHRGRFGGHGRFRDEWENFEAQARSDAKPTE